MSTIVTRAGKGSTLTWEEMDANLTNLNTDKLEADFPASQVANTPAGTISATDVQAAINELDSEKIGYTRLDDSDGSDLVGFIQSGTGAVLRTSQDKLREYVSVKDFGAVGDGVTDDTAAIQAARDYIASTGVRLNFPAGIYKYSVSPNWAIDNAVIEAIGEVRLRYTGTGNAVILDAGIGSELVYNVTMGDFIVEAPNTAGHGVFVRSVHHGNLTFNVRGCGTTSYGLLVKFAVCTTFNITVSGNEEGWYLGAKPDIGIYLDKRGVGETTSYCYFPNAIIEGVRLGIQLEYTLGNIFVGGTSEGCTEYGVYVAPTALSDTFIGTDFEVNTLADVYCFGNYIEFIKCDSDNRIIFANLANSCTINGGSHSDIVIDSGALVCSILNTRYNRKADGSVFTDDGTGTFISNVSNAATQVKYLTGSLAFAPGSIGVGIAATASVTVTGARLGDMADASFSLGAVNLSVSAQVTALNTVTVYFVNNITGAPINPGNGIIYVTVMRR